MNYQIACSWSKNQLNNEALCDFVLVLLNILIIRCRTFAIVWNYYEQKFAIVRQLQSQCNLGSFSAKTLTFFCKTVDIILQFKKTQTFKFIVHSNNIILKILKLLIMWFRFINNFFFCWTEGMGRRNLALNQEVLLQDQEWGPQPHHHFIHGLLVQV